MRKSNIQQLTLAAMVAAVYFVLCYFGNIFQLTFGPVQVRLGEALTVLPFLFPAAAPGLALGCLLTNILSPYGPIDMIVGTLATAIAAFLSIKMPRWYLAALPPIVVNALLLPPMWAWAEAGAVNGAFWGGVWTEPVDLCGRGGCGLLCAGHDSPEGPAQGSVFPPHDSHRTSAITAGGVPPALLEVFCYESS